MGYLIPKKKIVRLVFNWIISLNENIFEKEKIFPKKKTYKHVSETSK